MCIYLLCLFAALLCYTGFQNQSLIRSTFSPCSTCCFGLGFYNYKTCRNTSKDLGHNSRTSFWILLPELYNKVAEVMQEEKTTLKSLQNSFDDIILEQWVSMHLDHPHNGQYV